MKKKGLLKRSLALLVSLSMVMPTNSVTFAAEFIDGTYEAGSTMGETGDDSGESVENPEVTPEFSTEEEPSLDGETNTNVPELTPEEIPGETQPETTGENLNAAQGEENFVVAEEGQPMVALFSDGNAAEQQNVGEAVEVRTYDALVAALAAGEAVKLTANITAEDVIDASDANIDLGGFTLTLADNVNNNFFGTSTISNGTISIDGVEVGGDCIIGIGDRSNDATLNLNGVNLTGSNYSSAFAVLMVYGNGTLNISGGEWNLSNEKASSGGVIKNESGAGSDGQVKITDTVMTLEYVSRGIGGATVVLDGVNMTITGGDNGINGSALTVKNSTLNISGGEGRALTVTGSDVVVENSTLTFKDNKEADILFKTVNALTVDENSTLNECKVAAKEPGATINGTVVTGTEDEKSTVTVAAGATIIKNPFLSGEGTETSPYLINNADDLKLFRDQVNEGNSYSGKYVLLTTDINLNNEEWTPIGTNTNSFKGIFNGNGKIVSNLKITKGLENTAANNCVGFFGRTDSPAVIQNLTIENVDITGSLYVGAIVGFGYTGKKIENCTVKGNITIDAWWYAGVIGGNGYMSLVDNCHVKGADGSYIKGNDGSYIGGIWGFRGEGGQKITNCSVTNLAISGVDRVGGISGMAHYGNEISNCKVEGVTVQATDPDATTVGLIAGACQGTESSPSTFTNNTVENVTAKAGDTIVTGLYGSNINNETPVTNHVAKVNGVTYESLQAAVDAGGEVTLLRDVYLGQTVAVAEGSSVTLDLNGKAVTVAYDESTGRSLYAINNYGTLVLKDSAETGSITARGIQNLENGNLTVEAGVTIISCDKNGGAAIWNEADLTINGGTFKAPYVGSGSDSSGPGTLNSSGTAVINGGTFESSSARTYAIINSGTMTVEDGVVVNGAHGAIGTQGKGMTTINGGTFTTVNSTGGSDHAVYAGSGTVVINDGTFNGAFYAVCSESDAVIEIKGGEFDGKYQDVASANAENYVVTGGSYTDSSVDAYLGEEYVLDAAYEVAKQYAVANTTTDRVYYTLNDALAGANDNDTLKLLRDIRISGRSNAVSYEGACSLTIDFNKKTVTGDTTNAVFRFNTSANADATAPSTITLKNGTITAGSNAYMTIVAKGHDAENTLTINLEKMTLNHCKPDGSSVKVFSDAIVNVKSGTEVISDNGYGGAEATEGGVINVYSGASFLQKNTTNYMGMNISASFGGTVNIYGGNFTSDKHSVIVLSSGGTINISGGTFAAPNVLQADRDENNYPGDTVSVINVENGKFDGKLATSGEKATFEISGGTYSVAIPYEYCAEGYIPAEMDSEGRYGVKEGKYVAVVNDVMYEDLAKAFEAAGLEGTVTLMNDVDLNGVSWTPIGTKDAPFKGTFDGGNYKISNLTVESSGDYSGLFGYLGGTAEVKNLTIENPTVVGGNYVGAVAGCGFSSVKLTNVAVTGNIKIQGNYKVGGVIGGGYVTIDNATVDGNGTITGVYAKADAEGDNVGGIIGFLGEGKGYTVTNATVKGVTITGTRKVGGVVGSAFQNNAITNAAVSDVTIGTTANADYAAANAKTMAIGGLVGLYNADGNNDGTLSGSATNVTLTNESEVAGVSMGYIAGGLRGSEAVVAPAATISADVDAEGGVGATTSCFLPIEVNVGEGQTYTKLRDASAYIESQLTRETVTINIHGNVTLETGISFMTTKDVVVNGMTDDAAITLKDRDDHDASTYANAYRPAGQPTSFSFPDVAYYSFMEGSTIAFNDLTIDNQKTMMYKSGHTWRATYYMYAGAETANYKNVDFIGGVALAGNGSFVGCTFTEDDSQTYCLFVDHQYSKAGNAYSVTIDNCMFSPASTAYGAVKVANAAGTVTLTATGNIFESVPNKAAINADTNVIATVTGNTFNNCDKGTYKGDSGSVNDVNVDDSDASVEAVKANIAETNTVKNYIASVGDDRYETLQAAVEAVADNGTITLIKDFTLTENVDFGTKALTIEGNGCVITTEGVVAVTGSEKAQALNNVKLVMNGADAELTVQNLKFTGDSYINANNGAALTVTGCEADVTPSKITGRAAFIVTGTAELNDQPLLMEVENNTIIASKGENENGDAFAAAIFGWRYLADGTEIKGNTFGSEEVPYTFVAVKVMNAMPDAVITLEGNTVYGTTEIWHFNGFDLYQNCSRANTYTVISRNNNVNIDEKNIDYTACTFYLEGTDGATNVILMDSGSKENGNPVILADIDTNLAADYNKFYGVDVEFDENGKVKSGTFGGNVEALNSYCAEGYEGIANSDGRTYTVDKKDCTISVVSPLRVSVSPSNVVKALTEDVTLTAWPQDGYEFLGWYEEGSNTALGEELTFTLTKDKITDDIRLEARCDYKGTKTLVITGEANTYSVGDVVQRLNNYKRAYDTYTKVTVKAINEGFLYWVNEDGKIMSKNAEYEVIMAHDTYLTPVYETTFEADSQMAVVEFVSYYNQVLKAETYTSTDSITYPAAPTRTGYECVGWSMTEKEIQDAIAGGETYITVVPKYEKIDTKFTVTVISALDGKEEGGFEGEYGTNIELEPKTPAGMTFSHWSSDMEGKNVLSYCKDYKIYAIQDKVVYANYVAEGTEVVRKSIVTSEAYKFDSEGKLRFVSTRSVPEGYVVAKAGVIYTTDNSIGGNEKTFVLDAAGVINKESTSTVNSGVYVLNSTMKTEAQKDIVYYVRGYVIVTDEDGKNVDTIYSNIVSRSYNG